MKRIISLLLMVVLSIGVESVVYAGDTGIGKYADTSFNTEGIINQGNSRKVAYVIKTYAQRNKVKKKIKKSHINSKYLIKKINKYKKNYFKKKELYIVCVLNTNEDYNCCLSKIELNNRKLIVSVEKQWKYEEGVCVDTMVSYNYDTYMIETKKKNTKKVRKVTTKVIYKR